MMEEAQGSSSNKVPPFLTKTYSMVEDPSTNDIVSWSATERSFIVWNPLDFEKDLLPQYFKHNNFSSFIRQLNTYGFRKIDTERWEFANDDFVRNQEHRMKNIHRRKAIYSHSLQNAHGQGAAASLAESERQTLNANIQKLKHDKEQIFLELQRKEEERKMNEIKLQYFKGHLETVERKHQSVLSSVGQVLKKPGNEFGIRPLAKTKERKRRILRNNPFFNVASIEDHVGTSQVIHKENDPSVSLLSLNIEQLNLLDSSMTIWEKIKDDLGASYFQSHPNIDFDDSMNYVGNPIISCVQPDVEVQPKSLEVDMNSMPVVVVPDAVAIEPGVVVIPNHVATEPEVIVVPNPVATEPAVIDASDLVAVEPTVAVVPDFVEPIEQPVVTSLVTTGYNNEFWGQYLQDESEDEDIPSRVGQYWRTKRV